MLNGIGDAIDMGVCGGRGIGCLGALGESGRPMKPLGERGTDATEAPAPSRGSLGVGGFIGRWFGRGLKGNPGLIGFVRTVLCVMLGSFRGSEGLSTPANEVGGDKKVELPARVDGSGEKPLMDNGMGIDCGCEGIALSFEVDLADPVRDFEPLDFLDRLRSCSS